MLPLFAQTITSLESFLDGLVNRSTAIYGGRIHRITSGAPRDQDHVPALIRDHMCNMKRRKGGSGLGDAWYWKWIENEVFVHSPGGGL
jgi:hypothetical protein